MQEGVYAFICMHLYACNEIENAAVEVQPVVASLVLLFLSKLNASPSP